MRFRNWVRPFARCAAVVGVSATLLEALTGMPAQAAVTEIWAGASATVTRDHRTDPATYNVDFYYSTFVTADNAQLRIDSGAEATFRCYGVSGTGLRTLLFTTRHTKNSYAPLVAYGDGLLVNSKFSRPRGTLFDVNKTGIDQIFCDVSYADPFTHTNVFTTTNTASGYF